MKLIINNLRIPIEHDGHKAYLLAASEKTELSVGQIKIQKILSKSLDLKNTEQLYFVLSLVVTVPDGYANRQHFAAYTVFEQQYKAIEKNTDRPIVVGFGPAGMFAALELLKYGHKPRIFERGKTIEERSADVEKFINERQLNPESNIQFGEGGAGSYSDGKLFSRRHNNTSTINQVLKTFVKFGAPAEIEYISKPHLGTDVLCLIVSNIRKYIQKHGGEIFFNAKMTDLLLSRNKVRGIVVNGEQEFFSSQVFIALGHSARDTFAMLHKKGVSMEQRRISVGVRIEHPAHIINTMRYGKKYHNYPGIGAATYSLNHTNKKIKRGVYTFCMCPGGEIVNAASIPGMLVLNGMSYSDRSSPFSNGALVVNCHIEDYPTSNPLAGIVFQETIEKKAYAVGGSNWTAPAQSLLNFLGEQQTNNLQKNSYKMGTVAADMREIFPKFITDELQVAFQKWRKEVPSFVSHHAILLAAETRVTSPVRISRGKNYASVNIKNLFPIGEGAGYAGGITSSAADGIKAVTASMTK